MERADFVSLTHRLPYPPHGGGDMRNWQNIRALAAVGPVAVFGLGRQTPPVTETNVVAWTTSTEPPMGGAEPSPVEALAWLRSGHPSDRWFTPQCLADLTDLVERTQPSVAVVGTLWLHSYVAPLQALGCRVVLDAFNLEGPLHAELARERPDMLRTRFAHAAAAMEEAAFAAVDQIWVCSAEDAEQARALYPAAAPIAVVPNTVDVERYETGTAPGLTLVFPGTFDYPPNRTAITWLLEEIFPAVADARPDARLVLVGSGPTRDMNDAAARDPRIVVTGAVEDTGPYISAATVMPIPLREGGGTRLKALEALASRVPVVSTAKGVEGLGLIPGDDYLRAETTDEFVSAILGIADDPSRRTQLAARGLEVVRARFSFPVASDAVREALDQLGVKTKSLT